MKPDASEPLAGQIIVARHAFDAALLALDTPTPEASAATLAYGLMTLQPGWPMASWLVGRLRTGSLRTRGNHGSNLVKMPGATSSRSHGRAGLCMIHLAKLHTSPPQTDADWNDWIASNAAAYRLVCQASNPAIAVLWLRADGCIAARQQAGGGDRRWHGLEQLQLPGAGMLRLSLQNATTSYPEPDDDDVITGRYSRLGGALGWATLHRLQNSFIAIVGVGRVGSTLAHSLTRMGASVLLLDADHVEPHNLDGDLLPEHEGLAKVDASARFLRGLSRPGSVIDARMLNIASPASGTLLARADAVISAVDNDNARLWASAWCVALLKPHLDIGITVRAEGAEADLRLIPPGCGCLACVGGFANPASLIPSPAPAFTAADGTPLPVDFRLQRMGSLRSFSVAAGHLGLRMLEQLYAGQIQDAVFRRVAETLGGGLAVRDWGAAAQRTATCALCPRLYAGQLRGVPAAVVHVVAVISAASDRFTGSHLVDES